MKNHQIFHRISSGMALGGFSTFTSRITGLIRDILFAKYWGTGDALGSFFLAFTIPNLFRRILGEGALLEALVPLFTEKLSQNGKIRAFIFASNAVSVVSVILVIIIVSGILICEIFTQLFPTVFAIQTITFVQYLLPYTYFVCIAGILAGILNCFNHFAIPALSPVILNLCLIVALVYSGNSVNSSNPSGVYWLIFAILFAGVLQVLLLIPSLVKINFSFAFLPKFNSPDIRQLTRLVLPGVFGASVNQINVLFDRLFACWLGGYAITSLYFSERIVYLPIGIFAVALSTACLPEFSRAQASGDLKNLTLSLGYAIRHILYITVPCVLLLLMLPHEIIHLLYQRGNFDLKSTQYTISAMTFYAPGIPAFAAAKILRAGFFSGKDTRTPVKIALVCLLVNLVLNALLIFPLKQAGLALATTISSYLNVILLTIAIFRMIDPSALRFSDALLTGGRIFAGILLAAFVIHLVKAKTGIMVEDSMMERLTHLFIPAIAGMVTYLITSILLGSKEPREFSVALAVKMQRKRIS